MADIFRQQVRFYGKHGVYLEALTPDKEKSKDEELLEIERCKFLFDTVVDIYIVAPLIGFSYHRKAPKDGNEVTKNIMEGALSSHHDRLVFSYELLMVLDKESEPDLNERIRRAFRSTDELVSQGLEVFNDYARGGIEVLYEKLIDGAATPEDLLRNTMDFVGDWQDSFISEPPAELDMDALLERG